MISYWYTVLESSQYIYSISSNVLEITTQQSFVGTEAGPSELKRYGNTASTDSMFTHEP